MNQVLEAFAEQTTKITLEALAEKDRIIQELKQKLANCTCPKEEAC